MIRGEIRWYTYRLPDKRRPVLLLTRDEVIDRLNEIIVAPVTRTIRGLRTEVLLTVFERNFSLTSASCGSNIRAGPSFWFSYTEFREWDVHRERES